MGTSVEEHPCTRNEFVSIGGNGKKKQFVIEMTYCGQCLNDEKCILVGRWGIMYSVSCR